jgi:hypothetical protein
MVMIGVEEIWMNTNQVQLSPEEDAIDEPDELESEVDDLLPADLWF